MISGEVGYLRDDTTLRSLMIIRQATPEDADAVYQLAIEFATSFQPERQAFDQAFQTLAAQPQARVLVAIDGPNVAGYLLGFIHHTFYANGMVAWVEEVAVSESQRCHGIGRQLMAAFESWATDQDARLVGLATRRAADFYLALGYEDSASYFRKLLETANR